MDIVAFDAWRAAYDTMSYADQQAFYDRMEAEHPVQAGYALDGGLERFARFFGYVIPRLPKTYVLELGGWRGELAHEMLNRFPGINVWCNVEISRAAVAHSAFADARYLTYIPPDFAWKVELPPANVLVASHFIEHIRQKEFGELTINLPKSIRYMVLVAPLPDDGPTNWNGYHGSHILEVGWYGLLEFLRAWDFIMIDELSHRDFRVFQCLPA